MKLRETTITEKLVASITNILVVGLIYLPFHLLLPLELNQKKLLFIALFFLYSLVFVFINRQTDIGMLSIGSTWKKPYPIHQHLLFTVLYTASFSTLLYSFYFPFDLLLVNLLFLQLPCILLTKTTLHGYLSGNMVTIKDTYKKLP